jgi:hypothetical protein
MGGEHRSEIVGLRYVSAQESRPLQIRGPRPAVENEELHPQTDAQLAHLGADIPCPADKEHFHVILLFMEFSNQLIILIKTGLRVSTDGENSPRQWAISGRIRRSARGGSGTLYVIQFKSDIPSPTVSFRTP